MISHEVEKFIIENYPTMDLLEMELAVGYSIYHIRYIARKHGVRRQKNPNKYVPAVNGEERNINNRQYIKHNGRWMSYVRYVWEQHYGEVNKGQRLVLKDRSKPVTIDNIILCDHHQKKYNEPPTQKDVDFVRRVCGILGMEYDDTFLSKRKGDNILAKRIICVLHKELFEDEDGISVRQSRVGSAIGRDRTMVIVYENSHRDDYKFNPEYRKLYDKVKREYDTKEI